MRRGVGTGILTQNRKLYTITMYRMQLIISATGQWRRVTGGQRAQAWKAMEEDADEDEGMARKEGRG